MWDGTRRSAAELARATGTNEGHLAIAMRTLCSIGWLEARGDGYVAVGSLSDDRAAWLAQRLCPVVYASTADIGRLAALLCSVDGDEALHADAPGCPPGFGSLVSGAVLTPLLYELRAHHLQTEGASGSGGASGERRAPSAPSAAP